MSSIEFETDAPTPRRQSSREVADRVAVRRAMAELVRSIEALQYKTAFLKALVARHPVPHEELMARIVTLRRGLNAASSKFEAIVATLSARQQEHGRVEDVRRSLDTLKTSLLLLSA